MTATTTPPDIRPCIERPSDDNQCFTVAEYNAVQCQCYLRPLWARTAPPVEELTTAPANWGIRIFDQDAYNAQMRKLLGLD